MNSSSPVVIEDAVPVAVNVYQLLGAHAAAVEAPVLAGVAVSVEVGVGGFNARPLRHDRRVAEGAEGGVLEPAVLRPVLSSVLRPFTGKFASELGCPMARLEDSVSYLLGLAAVMAGSPITNLQLE